MLRLARSRPRTPPPAAGNDVDHRESAKPSSNRKCGLFSGRASQATCRVRPSAAKRKIGLCPRLPQFLANVQWSCSFPKGQLVAKRCRCAGANLCAVRSATELARKLSMHFAGFCVCGYDKRQTCRELAHGACWPKPVPVRRARGEKHIPAPTTGAGT